MKPMIKILFLLATHLVAVTVWPINQASGQLALPSSRADVSALTTVFNEQHVLESGHSICLRAAQLPPEARLAFLNSWVIPDPKTAKLRVTAGFVSGGRKANDAVRMISPAYDLIRLAAELDRIESLRAVIIKRPPSTPNDEVDRLTLLALMAIETGDDAKLNETLDQWFKLLQAEPPLLQSSPAAFVLIAQAAIDHSHPSPEIRELIRSVTLALQAEYNRDASLRHLVALSAQLEDENSPESANKETDLAAVPTQWHLANLERAFEHGNAFPKPLWQLQRGSYRNLSNYGDMLLMFQSPLLGDFSVEAATTGFGYREAHLVVGGRWTGIVYDHKNIIVGEPRGELVRQPLAPPLNDTNRYGFIRTRVDVQGANATTWMNGRFIHQQPLSQSDSPWLGVRTNYRVRGGVDDLQIAGEPIIPGQISMVDSPKLLGWYDYYQPPHTPPVYLTGWEVGIDQGLGDERHVSISHPRMPQLPSGSHTEQLLRYLRPFAEDGMIAFEFFYEPGQTTTHPAVGRTVFVLTDQGVKLHELTDGRFERTDLRPDNAKVFGEEDRKTLPLLTNQWNRVEVIRRGDIITVVVNGLAACEHPLAEATVAPQFGIFHFADQTALRVRNLTWTGGWPRTLPKIEEQQLASPLDEILLWNSGKPAQSFEHVFDERSIASGTFVPVQGNPYETMQASPKGLVVRQTSNDDYRGATVAPALTVGGDFDVTVTFDQIELQSQLEKAASVQFDVIADAVNQDLAGMQAARDRKGNRTVQCVRIVTVDGNVRRLYFGPQPAEGKAGRLRLSRRGETIYYLAADNDSDRFRLVGKESFNKADLQPQGIRLGVQAQGPQGLASVRFLELSVRAERLDVAVQAMPKPNKKSPPSGLFDSLRGLFD